MRHYLNIAIDGKLYGDNVASKPAATDFAFPPGAPSPGSAVAMKAAQDERRKAAADRYENAVFDVLVQIARAETGRAIIKELRRRGKPVTILPYLPLDKDWTNGFAQPIDAPAATRKGRLVRDGDGEPLESRSRGSGSGSGSSIEYITPALAATINSNLAISVPSHWSEGHDPATLDFEDEYLAHELIHAIRFAAGVNDRRRVPRQPRYDNLEEFYAMCITNVYRSERNRPGVRSGDHRKTTLAQIGGKNFLQLHFNRAHLRRFCSEHPVFVKELSNVECYFNPFEHLRCCA